MYLPSLEFLKREASQKKKKKKKKKWAATVSESTQADSQFETILYDSKDSELSAPFVVKVYIKGKPCLC